MWRKGLVLLGAAATLGVIVMTLDLPDVAYRAANKEQKRASCPVEWCRSGG